MFHIHKAWKEKPGLVVMKVMALRERFSGSGRCWPHKRIWVFITGFMSAQILLVFSMAANVDNSLIHVH